MKTTVTCDLETFVTGSVKALHAHLPIFRILKLHNFYTIWYKIVKILWKFTSFIFLQKSL